jgi:crossover junction endodeoxyribonuclease RusA
MNAPITNSPARLVIELPGEPQGKGRPRFARGRVYTPKETREYQKDLGWVARAVMGGRKPLTGNVKVRITAVTSPTNRFDNDNFTKIALDALQGIIFVNDRQAKDVHTRVVVDIAPMMRIDVEELI